MSDLKPCPFCGKEPNQATVELGDRPCFYYECENPKCHAKPETGWHDTEQEAIDAWNNRPIEDALRKEIAQLKKDKLEFNAQYFHKDETILVLKNRITELEFDNRSLVEQVNQMALKPNQEVIERHNYPEEKPEKTGYYIIYCTILNRVTFDFWHNDTQEWDKYGKYILAWAYLPKGVINEHKTN